MKFQFNATKAAQAAAVLLEENGGEMDSYLMLKMLYIADRESLSKWGVAMTGDAPFSMKHGPVPGTMYDLVKGGGYAHRRDWSPVVSNRDDETNMVTLLSHPGREELSNSEIELLKEVWRRFHKFTFTQIKNYSHALKEYDGSVIEKNTSKPIDARSILQAQGTPEEKIRVFEDFQGESDKLANLLGAF